MPRRKRVCPAGYPVHIVQRGNNRQICFASDADMAAFVNWLTKAAQLYGIAIHAWVLMTNHVHLLVTPSSDTAVSKTMQYLGRYYVRYFNFRYRRTGTLFDGRFKSSLVQVDRYLLACQRYIELNPIRAGLVNDPGDYVWSSYRAHALGTSARMWTPHPMYLALGKNDGERCWTYRNTFSEFLNTDVIQDIRRSLNTGLVFGNERFRNEVEQLTGQSQRLGKRGPKPSGNVK
ncbi:MAG: transposase [Desulfobacterales bacterium]|nr:transposase [Desulfofustis sp.]NNK95561.1 transposase [Desulfobacterales bacterium]